jgi:hypothetical protein
MRGWKLLCSLAALTVGAAASSQTAVNPAVEPEAVAALQRMSTYLSQLQSFELTSNATLDVVTLANQRLQIDGVVQYKAKRPGLWIDFDTDLKRRQYFYDGKQFTIYAPKLGYYASMPAPATNRDFLKMVYETFGISLPLEDLFRWADGDDSDLKALTSGFNVGTARIDGVETDHWAFRQGDFDWEVWIEKGDRPLPRKLVIVDRTETAMPGYSARLNWTLNPALAASDFTFTPGQDAKRIQMAKLTETAR